MYLLLSMCIIYAVIWRSQNFTGNPMLLIFQLELIEGDSENISRPGVTDSLWVATTDSSFRNWVRAVSFHNIHFNFSFIRCIYSIYMHVFLINLINCGVNLFNGTVIHVSIINIFLCLIYCVRFLSHKRSHVNRDGVINSIFKYVK